MIQRFQTLFMLFSIISLIVIIVNFPILINDADKFYIENFPLIKYIMLESVFLTTYSIFQYKKLIYEPQQTLQLHYFENTIQNFKVFQLFGYQK